MCGIYGMVASAGAPADIASMGACLVHRGPDGDGRQVHGRAALGCRRLAIIDGAGGARCTRHAPMDAMSAGAPADATMP